MHRSRKLLACVGVVVAVTASVAADEVTHWNGVLLQAIRVNGGPPCPIGRACAMTHTTVYDAVNSITRTHEPYIGFENVDPSASKEAAVAAAAHRILVQVYPAQQAYFDSEYDTRIGLIPAGAARDAGVACGEACAATMIANRQNDGSTDPIPYEFGGKPGDYITPEDLPPNVPPFNPEWGATTPFSFAGSPTQFHPTGPLGYTVMRDLLHSAGYADQFNEVKSFGARVSNARTEDQTRLAFFWANDVNGTYKPPGHLLNITTEISAILNLTLEQNARLFGLVGLALGDAGVVAWNAKYNTAIDLWRPITGIRQANTDGNPATDRDAGWLPLNSFTPPFPAWISGHSTFGGAWAAVIAQYVGTDAITFTISSEDPFYAELPSHPDRTFDTFSAAGLEDALSRIYLGVHWRVDCEDGFNSGQALGTHIGSTFFNQLCPPDFNLDGVVNSQDFFEYIAAFFAGDPSAEFNHDLTLNSQDFFEYLTAFFTGCE